MQGHRLRGAVCGATLALGLLACRGEVETHSRTLSTGRQIDVSNMFAAQGKTGLRLGYVYLSRHFDDQAVFDAEWAEFVQYAQQEADERNAVELMMIGHRRGGSFLTRLVRENERVALFTKQNGRWTGEK